MIAVILVVLLIFTRPQASMEVKPPALTRVEIIKVLKKDLIPQVPVTGVLRPRQSARLRFEVAGNVLVRHVEPGHRVAAHKVLLELDDADYQDALIEARSQLNETRATLKRDKTLLELARENRRLAEREYQRLEKLGKGSLASQSTRESAYQKLLNLQSDEARLEFSIQSHQARVARQQAALSRAQRNLERAHLAAPFEGRINQVLVEVGDYVPPNTQVLELIDTQTMELHVSVSGDVAAALTLGQNITVTVDSREIEGRLVSLQYDPDPQTHTHPLRIQVSGEGLMPGQLGLAKLALRTKKDTLMVPASAVMRKAEKHYLFQVVKNRLVRRAVVLGVRQKDWLEIQEGVTEGDTVVARDVDILSHDIEVQIERTVALGD
jgi:RND family efflux transporter MFP subunit